MELPKGLIFLYVPEKTTTGIIVNIEEKELITCENCKYCVEIEKTYCTQYEHTVKPNEWCSRAEKSKHSRTGDIEAKEYTYTSASDIGKNDIVCHCEIKENAELIAQILDFDVNGEIYQPVCSNADTGEYYEE